MSWIKWENILASFKKRGVGVGSLKAFNLALLQKWRWRFVTQPDMLWVNLLKAIHGTEAGLNLKGCSYNGVWEKIVGSFNTLHSSGILANGTLKCKVGDVASVRFWKDTWLSDEPLSIRYNRFFRLDSNEECLIKERLVNDGIDWIDDIRKSNVLKERMYVIATTTCPCLAFLSLLCWLLARFFMAYGLVVSNVWHWIVNEVTNHDAFLRNNVDCTGREGISALIKCTSAIRQLAYNVNAGFLENHGFLGMLGILDCTYWEWFGFSYGFKGQDVRRDHGLNPFILLEVVASRYLWTWHAFFGVVGSNNDIKILYQSRLFNDLKTGRPPKISFMANSITYRCGYYLVDGIYPELATLVKKIPEPVDDDHKQILYKQKQESTRKYMEQAFGVLKKK
nr:putative nuclease HARBI1 [Tanacetum cinerariifolium]